MREITDCHLKMFEQLDSKFYVQRTCFFSATKRHSYINLLCASCRNVLLFIEVYLDIESPQEKEIMLALSFSFTYYCRDDGLSLKLVKLFSTNFIVRSYDVLFQFNPAILCMCVTVPSQESYPIGKHTTSSFYINV